ncbi:MAG: hypothetical protein EHM33_00475 [Chloroflexi bacterium]|nr:MAG: hypothetical protein EHM33_00475 [Chloroflexota bacterium]
MSSAMMTIADHMASDFRDAVMEAEKTDMDTIDKILKEMNGAYTDYTNRDAVLSTQSEQAIKTLDEISNLRDVNFTAYQRRMNALRDMLTQFKETKAPALDPEAQAKMPPNVVKLGG